MRSLAPSSTTTAIDAVLRDELLPSILSPCFSVPTSLFFSNLNCISPHFSTSLPTTQNPSILLVCRRWHDIGLPHLYATVIIKNKRQATALWYTLSISPRRFTSTSRIRYEDEYLAPFSKLLSLSRLKSEDLCFRLHCPPDLIYRVSKRQLRRFNEVFDALEKVRPRRLAVIDDAHEGVEEVSWCYGVFLDRVKGSLGRVASQLVWYVMSALLSTARVEADDRQVGRAEVYRV